MNVVVVVIERAGLVDDELFKSLFDDIVTGLDGRCNLLVLFNVRSFVVDDRFDPVLVPLTARVADGTDSTIAAVIVFERLIIN